MSQGDDVNQQDAGPRRPLELAEFLRQRQNRLLCHKLLILRMRRQRQHPGTFSKHLRLLNSNRKAVKNANDSATVSVAPGLGTPESLSQAYDRWVVNASCARDSATTMGDVQRKLQIISPLTVSSRPSAGVNIAAQVSDSSSRYKRPSTLSATHTPENRKTQSLGPSRLWAATANTLQINFTGNKRTWFLLLPTGQAS